jgi:hypothetical protein
MTAVAPDLAQTVATALAEDLGSGDVTTAATVGPEARARGLVTQKAPGVVFGLDAAEQTFLALDPEASLRRLVDEGEWRELGQVLEIEGRAAALLSAERTALNFLARLSGVATMAARSVQAIEGTGAADPGHPQDHPRAASAGEGRRGGRRRHQPSGRPLRRDPDQGEPRNDRRRRRRRRPDGP